MLAIRQGYEDVAGVDRDVSRTFLRAITGAGTSVGRGPTQGLSWFAGYPHGARAAEEDGVGNWSQIQLSSNLQAQYVTAGMLPNQGHAVYPITEPVKMPPTGGPTPVVPQIGTQPQVPMGAHVTPVPQAPIRPAWC